ncbi:hypothetical protein DEM27_00050 [Metarhizobium album]|uniref:Uncharacterized protein n=1 Tax=Metarhizobium album TaxID=2182425 RepID=A0A2U2DWE1_9HYPH|nr:hypothetical protein [Rhizobium album]PWE57643.1 hypothetical protein DEM27_00050 [Rhizobium album]
MAPRKPRKPSREILAAENAALAAVLRAVVRSLVDEKPRDERDAILGAMRKTVDIELSRHHLEDEALGAASKIISDIFFP